MDYNNILQEMAQVQVSDLEDLIGKKYVMAILLRHAGKTFKEIGEALGGLSTERGRAIFYKAIQKYERSSHPESLYALFSARTANALSNGNFADLKSVINAVGRGDLTEKSIIKNFGKACFEEICNKTGARSPKPRANTREDTMEIIRAIRVLERHGYEVRKRRD